MLIQSATQIDHALYTGPFDVITPVGGSDPRRGGTPGKLPAHFESVIVSIGRPEWWNVRQLSVHQGVESDALLRELLRRHDVFLVRFACSLVPKEAEMIASAHFVVTTESEGSDGSTVAHDLLPMNVVNEEKSSVSFKLSPSLKFEKKIELGLGEVSTTVEFVSLEPEIVAFGLGAARFGWMMRPSRRQRLLGVRSFFALLKCPRGVTKVPISMKVYAVVQTSHGLFRSKISDDKSAALTVVIGES